MDFLNSLLMSTKSLEKLGFLVGECSYLLIHIATAELPVELKTEFEQRYVSDSRVLQTFEQLVEFLEKECWLFDNILREVRESSGNASHSVTPKQRADDNARMFEIPPLLHRKSNPKPRPVMRRNGTRDDSFCKTDGHEITSCERF
ncbi:hypothetical protein EVAR_95257_1 [Eumeta japonica]|uniref:Uncharacterized protein n=1 Tax=Eumeta variegata TaxID=151549 RepID=A0A4C1ULA6_EUMVA|nr:hypothetical protein EVAR_95257_1 [Eumeta japonica]